MIRACQRAGLNIAEIRSALTMLPEGHIPDRHDWDRLAAHLRRQLRNHIDQLERILNEFNPQADK